VKAPSQFLLGLLAFLTLAFSSAAAQNLGAIANKTAIVTHNMDGTRFDVTFYIAPSGKIYSSTNAYRSVMGTAPNALSGGEYQIGRTVEHDHSFESIKCHSKNSASLNGRTLQLRSVTTCSGPLVGPFTTTGGNDIEFLSGEQCNARYSKPVPIPIVGCKVVAGRDLRQ
jgi:hypothetical protein